MKRILLTLSFLLLMLLIAGPGSTSTTLLPNDLYFSQQWGLSNQGTVNQLVTLDVDNFHTVFQQGAPGADIGWLDARQDLSSRATAPVIVAVIDSGIDAGHPELRDRIAMNGTVPMGKDFLMGLANVSPLDTLGHGTHVSGIIAADSDNALGIAGVAPSTVKILPLKILSDPNDKQNTPFGYNGKLISDIAADAIRYAMANGASIINMSLGWPKIADTPNVRQAAQDAINAGILIVAAAGNDRKDQTTYPCAYEGVLCVGSITNTGALAYYSNLGGMVDLLAPGDGILSTYPRNIDSSAFRIQGYELLSGTSQAAPHVAGAAAVLKSIYPNISLNELKARLLTSTAALPSDSASIYGLINLKRSIDAQPQPVYLPDFKAVDAVVVDENTLKATGSISVQNIWQSANTVQAEVMVNGQSAGSAQSDSLANGASLTIPWTYQFASMDDSSKMHVTLQISDSSGVSKQFSIDATAVRQTELIAGNQLVTATGVKPADWISANNGHFYTNLQTVDSYPSEQGLPRYYRETDSGTAGLQAQIFDPASATPVQIVQVPGMQRLLEVVRLKAKGDGNMDWAFIGVGQDNGSPVHFEVYYMDASFQPLYGTMAASEFEIFVSIPMNPDTNRPVEPIQAFAGGLNLAHSYGGLGSWIQLGGKLFPAFLSQGQLPDADNFGKLNMRHYANGEHLYYLNPLPVKDATKPVTLEVRALDNAAFQTKYPNSHLLSFVPESSSDMSAGRERVLVSMGDQLDAQTLIWDIQSTTNTSTAVAPGWDSLSSGGSSYWVLNSNTGSGLSTFLNFFDSERGSLAWINPDGSFLDRSEFTFSDPEDPIAGLIGAFDLTGLGRYWFIQSSFDLVGYHQETPTSAPETKMISIERDSSFTYAQFDQMLIPVLVGTQSKPLPGVYIDTTLVRGNQVSVAVWNPSTGNLEKPLRYSLRLPDNCLEMNPVQLKTSDPTSFAIPLLCQQNSQVQLDVVRPQQ